MTRYVCNYILDLQKPHVHTSAEVHNVVQTAYVSAVCSAVYVCVCSLDVYATENDRFNITLKNVSPLSPS